jgi:integrase
MTVERMSVTALEQNQIYRSRAERISAQETTYFVEGVDGTIGLLDGDYRPVSEANRLFRKLRRQGRSKKYVKNVAYNLAVYIRACATAGYEWLYPPQNLVEDYFHILRKRGLSLASANTQASRLHQVFRFALEEGLRENYPYETQIVTVNHGGAPRTLTVPAFLPARGDTPALILPAATTFRRWHEALQPDAQFPAEILQMTGLRLFELQKLLKAWLSRQRSASGAAVVRIQGKGERVRNVYVPSALADKLDAYRAQHKLLLRENGKPWTERALSAAFLKAKRAIGAPITAHVLRHAYGSWALFRAKRLFEEGKLAATPVLIVQELLGHASYETTARTYLHIFAAGDGKDLEDLGGGPLEALVEVMEPDRLQFRKGAE